MEKLLGGADAEAGGFLAMERAQAHEVDAAFLELHILAHDVDHVDAGQQLLDERLGDGHLAIFTDKTGLPGAVSGQTSMDFSAGSGKLWTIQQSDAIGLFHDRYQSQHL
jgi:hypothetical protein